MSCRDRRIDISALLDGQLDPESQSRLQAHLETCAECSAFYRELTATQDVFDQARQWGIAPSPALWTHIRARIEPVAAEPAFFSWLAALILRPRLSYATAMAVLIVSLLFVSERQESTVRQSLAALDAYQLEVEGNPFFVQPSLPAGAGTNPFERK